MLTPNDVETRKDRERDFHDARFGAEKPRPADRFYAITGTSSRLYNRLIAEKVKGRRVLEYGCGPGSAAFQLAEKGAIVSGIDISPVAIDIARNQAQGRGVTADFRVMDAEQLEFSDASFDLVCGSGIIHHLKLEAAFAEISRVLAHDGRAVFLEPLGHNPVINVYRNRTPEQRTSDEHPLLASDFKLARRYFEDVQVSYHHLTTLAALPFSGKSFVGPLSEALDRIDAAMFAVFKPLALWSWFCILQVSKPRSAALGKS